MGDHFINRFSVICVLLLCLGTMCYGQSADTRQKIDKRNLVTREWNTDLRTNVRFLDHETIYGSDGKKIEETEYSKLGRVWTKKYEYGENGKISKELTYNELGRLDNIQKFEYDDLGRKSAVYTYDSKGKMVRMKIFEYQRR